MSPTARALAAFGASLRDEVDLSQLTDHLVEVVHGAMQPTHLRLWVKDKPASARPPSAPSAPRRT